jgi:NDP-sugar pyrophosphorylase family protein
MAIQILEQLAASGVERAVLNLHHLPETIRRMLDQADPGPLPAISFTEEPEILGTAGGIGNAAGLLRGAGPILVRNSDFLADIDIAALVTRHRRSGMLATLVLAPHRAGYSEVDCDGEGRIISIAGRPEIDRSSAVASLLFTGCHIIEESLLELIPAGRPSDIVRDLYVELAREGRLGSFIHRGFWWEFGRPPLYLDGSLALIGLDDDRRARIARGDPVRRVGSALAALGGETRLHASARFAGRVALGSYAEVGESAHIEESVLMPGAAAGAGSCLKRAVLAPGVRLPDGFEAEDALVCHQGDELLVTPLGGTGDAG